MQQVPGAQSVFLFERFLWRYKLLSVTESRAKDVGGLVIKCLAIMRRKTKSVLFPL